MRITKHPQLLARPGVKLMMDRYLSNSIVKVVRQGIVTECLEIVAHLEALVTALKIIHHRNFAEKCRLGTKNTEPRFSLPSVSIVGPIGEYKVQKTGHDLVVRQDPEESCFGDL